MTAHTTRLSEAQLDANIRRNRQEWDALGEDSASLPCDAIADDRATDEPANATRGQRIVIALAVLLALACVATAFAPVVLR